MTLRKINRSMYLTKKRRTNLTCRDIKISLNGERGLTYSISFSSLDNDSLHLSSLKEIYGCRAPEETTLEGVDSPYRSWLVYYITTVFPRGRDTEKLLLFLLDESERILNSVSLFRTFREDDSLLYFSRLYEVSFPLVRKDPDRDLTSHLLYSVETVPRWNKEETLGWYVFIFNPTSQFRPFIRVSWGTRKVKPDLHSTRNFWYLE